MPRNKPSALLRRLILGFVFLWFFLGGIAHFVFTKIEMGIVPTYLPAHRLLVLVSGVFELLGAAGILFKPTRAGAGCGLILLTAAVTPANIYMWQHPQLYPSIPPLALFLRLPFQALLMLGIWWSTCAAPSRPAPRRGAGY